MTISYYKAVIYKNSTHQPLGTGDKLTADSIPVSALPGNGIRAVSDGLYVGGATPQVYYVSTSLGNDVPTAGSKAAPYKTLSYALDQIIANYDLNNPGSTQNILGNVTVALKAGETFPLDKSYEIYGYLRLTFWGDPQYGDFNGPTVGLAQAAFLSDLQRPIIAPAIQPSTVNGVNHFQAHDASPPATLNLFGVRVDLPAGAASNSDYCSFFNTAYSEGGRLQLWGSIINRLDTTSSYGAFGVHARSHNAILEQYCSQFWIQGQPIVPVTGGFQPTNDQLLARKWFIIFYPDLHGNNQSGGQLLDGPAPSGLMQLIWSVVPNEPVPVGKTNLATFPVLNDQSFGIANYFFNLTRDNQSRPLNCQSAQLF